jgi:threonine aldolase
MTLTRRQFLGGTLPLGALALTAYAGAPASLFAAGAVAARATTDDTVFLYGDSVLLEPQPYADLLQSLVHKHGDVNDFYLKGGAVTELEAAFSALLGKEDTVLMPSGTLANHVAMRLLCGDSRHALVQQESHLYRDEADAVPTLSGINLVPLAPGKAAPTLDEVRAAIDRAENGPYPIKVGAISLESPVRRADGATVPMALIEQIAAIAQAKGIGMHLDGARLLLMSGMSGFDPKSYCAPFDTVYVSLYKYLNAPFGGVLSGTKAQMAKARELRHIFGGTLLHGWLAALPALDALEGFVERFAGVRQAAERLLARLDKTSGYKVHRIENGSNIAYLEVSPKRGEGLGERLKRAHIEMGHLREGKLELMFNETWLRQDTDQLMAAFAGK